VPTDDGRRHSDGVLVHRFVEGRPPDSANDWRAVVDALARLHEATVDWPQRPGFGSIRSLAYDTRGGDVNLSAMPEPAARAVRDAWRPIADGPEYAIHGDVGRSNLLVNADGIALLDWDEARVDVPWRDFAALPYEIDVPVPYDRETLVTAGVAWEAATCWVVEPEYAARRLDELLQRSR
jgi:Ser/Thr protein kinase RdoA (MazF antagonist)